LLRDLRFGIRTLLGSPWSTAITVLSLALGIGINVAVFTAYKAFFLRQLDARNAGEMVNIALSRESGATDAAFSYPDYDAYRASIPAFSGLIAYRPAKAALSSVGAGIDQRSANAESVMGRLGLLPPGVSNVEFAQVFIVSENYFQVLGVPAFRGRVFATGGPSVLISENYWQSRFSADPAIIGKTIRLNNVAVEIIGITPRDFTGTNISAPAFWAPVSLEPLLNADPQWLSERENLRYRLFGRLAPGAGIAQAKAQMSLAADRLRALHDPDSEFAKPASALLWPGSPLPLPPNQLPGLYLAVFLIMFATLMVLAVASANAGSLQLARARSREAELRTRLSLGATRLRVMRQLLTENALVGLLAGAVALPFSWALLKAGVHAFIEAMPVEIGHVVYDVSPDIAVFSFVFLISLTAGVLSGLAPAIQIPRSALTSAGRANTQSLRCRRLQNALVAVQVALSLVLMIMGTMFVSGAVHSLGVDPGYDSKHLVQLDLQLPGSYTAARRIAAGNELRSRLLAIPGVKAVTRAAAPGSTAYSTAAIPVNAAGRPDGSPQSVVRYTYVQPGYFETLGIPLYLGTGFDRDREGGQFVVLSESAAHQLFGGERPLGRNIRLGAIDEKLHKTNDLIAGGPAYQVIGVARDTHGWEFDGSDSLQIYLPLSNRQMSSVQVDARPFLVRTQPSASALLHPVETAATSIDPEIGVASSTFEEALRRSPPFIGSTLAAAIASSIGSVGLLLALMGIFGTVSHIVALRTREVGIRIAVGAQKGDVLRLILGESSQPVIAGLAAGMILAAGVVYLLRGIFYGVNAIDGFYFVAVSLLFFGVALLASYPPARRAMRVDPVVALRHE
jgi:predicted permease